MDATVGLYSFFKLIMNPVTVLAQIKIHDFMSLKVNDKQKKFLTVWKCLDCKVMIIYVFILL